MGVAVELTNPEDHPLRKEATHCPQCGVIAVFFNDGNIDVSCHACGASEHAIGIRQYHFSVYLVAQGFCSFQKKTKVEEWISGERVCL